jgi:hypothetical protein
MSDALPLEALVAIAREVMAARAPDARLRLGKIPENPSARVEWDTDSAISTLMFWAAGTSYSTVMDVEEDATSLRALNESFSCPEEFRAVLERHIAFVAAV